MPPWGLVWRPIHSLEARCWNQATNISVTHHSNYAGPRTREAPTVSPKSLLISGAKNEPSGHGEVLLLKWQKDQQMWKTFSLYIAKFWRVQRCNFFRVGNRTCIVSYSDFRKLHLCTLVFLYLFFRRKITEIDRAVIPSEVIRQEPYPPQFLKFGHVPLHPSKQWLRKKKIMILCSICTLIFVSAGRGDAGPVTCTCASSGVQEVVVWTAFTSACHTEGSIFGPEKVKKN